MPNTGKLVMITGRKAQCIAQAIEVAIPIMSQFIFNRIKFSKAKVSIFATMMQIYHSLILISHRCVLGRKFAQKRNE